MAYAHPVLRLRRSIQLHLVSPEPNDASLRLHSR